MRALLLSRAILACATLVLATMAAPINAQARPAPDLLRRSGGQAFAYGGQYRHLPDAEGAAAGYHARSAARLPAGGSVQEFFGPQA